LLLLRLLFSARRLTFNVCSTKQIVEAVPEVLYTFAIVVLINARNIANIVNDIIIIIIAIITIVVVIALPLLISEAYC